MSQLAWSEKKQRHYRRKFDHDEARRRYQAGEKVLALAREYGVNRTAVEFVVYPGLRERWKERRYVQTHTECEDCGAVCLRLRIGGKNPLDGRTLCAHCRSISRRESAIVDEEDGSVITVKCATCQEWWEPEMFPRGKRYVDLRDGGFATECRSCQTDRRRRSRERHKTPCVECGTPRSSDPRSKIDTGRCRRCLDKVRRVPSCP